MQSENVHFSGPQPWARGRTAAARLIDRLSRGQSASLSKLLHIHRLRFGAGTAVALVAALVIPVLGAWQMHRTRAALLEDAEHDTRNLSHVLSQHASRIIEETDIVLAGVVRLAENPDRPALTAFLKDRSGVPDQIVDLAVIDAQGDWIADSLPPHAPINSSDRSYFKWHRDNEDRSLHLGDLITSRSTKEPAFTLSRRINAQEGSFAGTIRALLAPDYLQAFYGSLDVGSKGTIALWTDTGKLLVRHPPVSADVRDVAQRSTATRFKGQQAGWIHSRSLIDGVDRIVAFEHLEHYPLVVTAAISVDDALGPWRHEAMVETAVLAFLSIALLSLALALQGHQKRVASSEREVREKDRMYRLLAANSSDLTAIKTDFESFRSYVSPSSNAIVGWSPEEFRVLTPDEFIHPDDQARVKGEFDALSAVCPRVTSLHRAKHKAGHYIWLETTFQRTTSDTDADCVVTTARDVTARLSAEAALRESEGRYRLLAESSSDMVERATPDGVRLYVSPASSELIGFAPAELVGTRFLDLVHPDDCERVALTIFESWKKGLNILRLLYRIRQKRGSWIWVEVQVRLMREASTGVPVETVSNLRDVTQRQLLQQQVEAGGRLLRATLDSMEEGLIVLTSDRRCKVWNSRAIELLALPTGKQVFGTDAAATSDIVGSHLPWLTTVLAEKHRKTSEHRLPNGTILEVNHTVLPGGEALLTFGDITVRRRSEYERQESEARYRLLAESSSDVITQLDLNFKRSYVSPGCKLLLGFEPSEMLGVRPSASVHPDDAPGVRRAAEQLVAGSIDGDKVTTTHRVLHKRGHWVWVEANINLLRDPESGAARSLICSLRDVTERQLAARQQSEFVANMSHELRTPLTGILSIHELLQNDPTLGAPQRRYLDMARDAGLSLLSIVNDVLDFSKIDAGQLTIERIPFDLESLVDACRDLAHVEAQNKGLDLHTTVGQSVGLIGDPARLRQVILNLVMNAVKFTDHGSVTVNAQYRAAESRLRVEVADTGIGITADKLPLVFERFSQADASITREYGGTGLGLAISKRLIELMGGEIGVTSAHGRGSSFWLEVPMPKVASDPQLAREGLDAPSAYKRSVLLAEDNLVNQEIIAAMLEQRGHRVTTVDNGAAAVAAARIEPGFDVILMDIQMPVLDGFSAAQSIRAGEAMDGRNSTPIIGLTANAMSEDIERCQEAGMQAHVAKPIVWKDLFAVMERVVSEPVR